jgi:long-chain acyl-CoA synthetase
MYDFLGFPSRQLVRAKQRRDAAWVNVQREHDIFFLSIWSKNTRNGAAVHVHPDDVAVLQYTGGTTELPQGSDADSSQFVSESTKIGAWFTTAERVSRSLCARFHFSMFMD